MFACKEESLNSLKYVVAHTTSVLETVVMLPSVTLQDCRSSLLKKIWAMQANTCTIVKTRKYDIHAPTYKGLKEFHSTNNMEHEFWGFFPYNIK